MGDRPPPPPPRLWRCPHCGRVLGQLVNGTLHEPNGNKSGMPIVRRCPECGRRTVKLAS